MPVKHIPEATWRKVEKKMVEMVIETKLPLKDSEVLNLLILKGLREISAADIYEARKCQQEAS